MRRYEVRTYGGLLLDGRRYVMPDPWDDERLAALLVRGPRPVWVRLSEYDPALADREWPDVNYYAEAKQPVIDAVLARAGWVAG